MQGKLFIRDGKMQIVGQHHFFVRRCLHVRIIEFPAVLAALFRKIHGVVHILENLVDGVAILRIHRHPDAGRQMKMVVEYFDIPAQFPNDAVGGLGAELPVQASRQHHDEFIPADAAHKSDFARLPLDAFPRFNDNSVAVTVSERIVHGLEIIHVNIQDAAGRLSAARLLHHGIQPLVQMRAIGQSRQDIRVGQMADFFCLLAQGFLGLLLLGDVLRRPIPVDDSPRSILDDIPLHGDNPHFAIPADNPVHIILFHARCIKHPGIVGMHEVPNEFFPGLEGPFFPRHGRPEDGVKLVGELKQAGLRMIPPWSHMRQLRSQ